jgi:hypothetical protein
MVLGERSCAERATFDTFDTPTFDADAAVVGGVRKGMFGTPTFDTNDAVVPVAVPAGAGESPLPAFSDREDRVRPTTEPLFSTQSKNSLRKFAMFGDMHRKLASARWAATQRRAA